MTEVNNTLKFLIRNWLNSSDIEITKDLLSDDNIEKLIDKFLSTKPYNSMKNEILIISSLSKIMKIEVYRILINNN